jgi:hypothetical protein
MASRTVIRRGRRALGSVGPRRFKRRRALTISRLSARKLEQIAKSDRPVVAGPWVGGVGMELLYWIPLLNWVTTEGGIDPARVVAISRGGADAWYSGVAREYHDLFDHHSPAELRLWHEDRLRHPDTESHIGVHNHDREAFKRAREQSGEKSADWLHPVLMHRLFAPRWEWGAPGTIIATRTEQRPLPARDDRKLDLPESYLAVKGYFNLSFPATDANREALERVVSTLAEQTPVVLVRGVEEAGGHEAYIPSPGLPVRDVSKQLDPRQNLSVQTQIIRGARALISPYGGFSFLGPYADTPTLALYSTPHLTTVHLDTIERVARRLADGRKRLYRARHIGSLQAVSGQE